jgi:uncharacterized protein YchJ
MKFVRCVVVVLVAGSLATARDKGKSASSTASSTDQKIIDLEKSLWEAWKNKDAKPFDALLTPNFSEVDNTGSSDRAAAIDGATKCDVKDYSLSDSKVTWLNKDTALLSFKANMHASCMGQATPENVNANSVYVKQNGRWLEAFHSEVPAPSTSH